MTFDQFKDEYRSTHGGDLSELGPALVEAGFDCFRFKVGVHDVFVQVQSDGKNWVGIWKSGKTTLMQFTPISQQYLWYSDSITAEEFNFQRYKFINLCTQK